MKKILSLILVLALALSLGMMFTSCGGDEEGTGEQVAVLEDVALGATFAIPDNFKIGFICLHDEASTYDKNFIDAAERIKTALNLKDSQVIYKKNVPESNACYEAAADLVDQGCKVVFANSFGHETYMIKAAKEFTNVQFCHATGTMAHTEGLSNYHNAFASIYEGRYLAGVAAGLKLNEMIKDGKITAEKAKIGYVGAFTYAEVISGYTSFFLGARSVCPSATMEVQFTGSWYDEVKEKDAATALINSGCVLISQHADSMGAPTVCEEKGVPNISYNGSTVKNCPNTFIISSAINWTPYYYEIIKASVNGTAIPADWTGTIATGSVVLSALNVDAAAEGTLEVLQETAAKLKDGTLNVFDTAKFTINNGEKVDVNFLADVDTDAAYTGDTKVVTANGIFEESKYRSAPYFELRIDGIKLLNEKY